MTTLIRITGLVGLLSALYIYWRYRQVRLRIYQRVLLWFITCIIGTIGGAALLIPVWEFLLSFGIIITIGCLLGAIVKYAEAKSNVGSLPHLRRSAENAREQGLIDMAELLENRIQQFQRMYKDADEK